MRTRKLTPMQKRILRILFDKGKTAENSREIADELRLTKDSVDHQLSTIYSYYGVHSARGLFRVVDQIATELD